MFDFADPNIQAGRRNSSTIASQALLLMNHPFVIEQSKLAAANALELDDKNVVSRVQRAYAQVIGRPPHEDELAIAVDFILASREGEQSQSRWALLYQTLFQSLDFRYLN